MNYYIYKHTTPNEKIYIGITKQAPNKRWLNGLGYKNNDYFFKAILKYGWENIKHEILFANLSKEEAALKEIELIADYKSNNRNYGYNLTIGGDGVHGYKHSKETLNKIKDLWPKGHIPWNKGKKTPQETRIKQSIIKKGKPSPRKGNKLTEEQKKRLKEQSNKKTYQYDLQGNFIKCWVSVKEASKTLNINGGNIALCCTGKRKTAGNFIWKHRKD